MQIIVKLLLLILFPARLCFAYDIQTSSLIEIKNLVNKEANKDSLVIFDVDDVLIAPTDAFAITDPIRKKLMKDLKAKYDNEKQQIILSDFFIKRTVRIVNPEIIGLLNNLKKRRIPTTALTGWWTGKFGKILLMEELRFKGLKEVNISFIDISPFKNNNQFPELKTKDGVPQIKNGIILTALADKGDVLLEVFKKEKLKFKKIIFIDDDLSQVASVRQACAKIGVEFIGVHYTEAKLIPTPSRSEEIEELRFKILEKHHIWLCDEDLRNYKMQL